MIGDFILWIKEKWKQEITCIHFYIPDGIGHATGLHPGSICKKCRKLKD